jgi:hypothetical protein
MKQRKCQRIRLAKAQNNREHNIILKGWLVDCYICCKRAGSFYATCMPIAKRGRKGRKIPSHHYREYRSWKNHRKTQWKEK